jgi:hypothetical protein
MIALTLSFIVPAAAQGDEYAQIRFVHASADAPAVDVDIDGVVAAESLTFGAATEYFLLPAGAHTATLGDANTTLTLEAGQSITALLTDADNVKVYRDDLSPLELGVGRLSVIQANPEVEAVDLLTDDGATLVGGVSAGKASPKVDLPAGVYDLTLTATGGDGSPLRGSSELEVNTGTLYSIILLQGGSLTLTAPTQASDPAGAANLRLAHVSPDAPKVDVYLDNVKAFARLAVNQATESVALPAGTYDVAFYPADSDPATTEPLTANRLVLSEGVSRVLVMMGKLAELQLAAFIEDTTPPTAGNARLTVIHAAPDVAEADLAFGDGTTIFPNLAFAGQVPVEVPPDLYEINFNTPGAQDAILKVSRTELEAGRAYTLIVGAPSQNTQIVMPVSFSLAVAPVVEGAPAVAAAPPAAEETDMEEPTAEPTEEAMAAAEEPEAEETAEVVYIVVTATPQPGEETAPAQPAAADAAPAQPAAAAATDDNITGQVLTDPGNFLNVRPMPSMNTSPLPFSGLPSGATIEILGRDASQNWLYMQWETAGGDPVIGWVAAQFIGNIVLYGEPLEHFTDIPVTAGQGGVAPSTGGAAAAAGTTATTADTEAPAVEAAPAAFGPGAATFTITDFNYDTNNRAARMWVNVTNNSMTPALASGNWYPTPNPDGGKQWVTLLKAGFLEPSGIPYPYSGDAPLWEFRVYTSDGLVFSAFAGCEYYNTIVGRGFEPTAEGGFTWEQVLEGGWFSCGGDWGAGNLKPAEDLAPGETASVPLNIWLTNPHLRVDDPTLPNPPRYIERLEFIPRTPDGQIYGVLDSQIPPRP